MIMIRIDTILKYVKIKNENMTKYSKIEQMVHEMLRTETKLFLGSLRASRAIKKGEDFLLTNK
jgi:hypothetical protein